LPLLLLLLLLLQTVTAVADGAMDLSKVWWHTQTCIHVLGLLAPEKRISVVQSSR
jgi:hypothetical protein